MVSVLTCNYTALMFKTQFRDGARRDKSIPGPDFLPFIPADGKTLRIRRNANSVKVDTYRVVDHDYDTAIDDPGWHEIIIYLTRVDN